MTLAILAVVVAVIALAAVATVVGTGVIERAHPPQGQFVNVGDARVHYADLGGPASGKPAVVLVHGASGNLEDMRLALADRLGARYRVILVDRPGHGWSERPPTLEAASPAYQAALLRKLLERLEIERAILVGHSWGAALVTAFALDDPARAAGLVLVAPVSHPFPGGVAWYYDFALVRWIGRLFTNTFSLPVGAILASPVAAAVFAPQAPPESYLKRAAIALVLRPKNFLANALDVVNLRAFLTAQAPHYSEIKVPTIIITGNRDEIVSPRIHSRALATSLPNAKLVVLEGVGHMPHHVAPDAIAAAIDEIATEAGRAALR